MSIRAHNTRNSGFYLRSQWVNSGTPILSSLSYSGPAAEEQPNQSYRELLHSVRLVIIITYRDKTGPSTLFHRAIVGPKYDQTPQLGSSHPKVSPYAVNCFVIHKTFIHL